jgi:hypothetical protein
MSLWETLSSSTSMLDVSGAESNLTTVNVRQLLSGADRSAELPAMRRTERPTIEQR